MLARAVLLSLLLASTAQAAAFDDLKADLSVCLRFELDGTRSQARVPATARAGLAIRRCASEVDRLDRADPRRLRGDRGLSPSTWSVIEAVFGRGARGQLAAPSL